MKRVVSLVLTFAVLLCMVPFAVFAESESNVLILGDTNSDSKVKINDATAIQKHLAFMIQLNENEQICADCNSDKAINIKDVTWIQKFLAKMDCPYKIGEPIEDFSDNTLPEDNTGIVLPDDEFTTAVITDATEPETTTSASTTVTEIIATEATEPETTTSASTTVTEIITTDATEPSKITDPSETGIVLPDDEFTTAPEATDPTEVETMTPYNPVKPETKITVYFSNNVNWQTVNAYVYNEEKQLEAKAWPGTAMAYHETNALGEKIYKLTVDVSEYNRIIFNNGTSQTLNAALTVASSGFFVTSQTPKKAMQLGVYAYGTEDYGEKTTVNLKYPTGYNKPIEIWTPAGYDPEDTSKKYSVIYLIDGQQQFDDSDAYNGGWGSDEVITALMKNGGDGVILVGIDNSRNRDNELTPDLGDIVPAYNYGGFKNGTGHQFAEFVAKTVVPYVEENYNVYTDAQHATIAGSSSGGIEAFYIGMEFMDEFGRIGALSPAFMLYDKATWLEYFSKFDFAEIKNLPRIYFYNGGGDSLEQELLPYARDMKLWLAELGYDENKMTFVYDEKNSHNEAAWRNIIPEMITWLLELQ